MIRQNELINFSVTKQASPGLSRIERVITTFFGLGLAALAIFLFVSNSPLIEYFELYNYFDDRADLIACVGTAVLALVFTVRWERKKPLPAESAKYQYWCQTIIRYLLAYIFLVYGFAKVFENQFHSSLSMLDTPLGDVSGLQITWRFFGYSYAYTLFVAASQIISALLFFFRRTTLLGAMILLPVVSNIVIVNFTHQIPVKLYSAIYLIMTLYLLALDHRKLKALFWDHQPFGSPTLSAVKQSKRLALVKYAVIFAFITTTIADNYYAHVTYAKVTTPLYGAWEVEEYRVNEVVRQAGADPKVWRKFYVESDRIADLKAGQPRAKRFLLMLDAQKQTIRLTDPMTDELFIEGAYKLESPDKLTIEAVNGEGNIRVRLNRVMKAGL